MALRRPPNLLLFRGLYNTIFASTLKETAQSRWHARNDYKQLQGIRKKSSETDMTRKEI
jgi:hypothetical protein